MFLTFQEILISGLQCLQVFSPVEFKHAQFQDISRHEVTCFPQFFLWAKGKEEMVYIEEDPRPSKDRYIDVHILFYGVGLGITILLMYLGLNPGTFEV